MSLSSSPSCSSPPCSSAIFRGDDDALLDHLVHVSAAHKAKEPLPGFGRELVSFYKPGEELAPLPTKNWQSCGSPPRSSSLSSSGASKQPAFNNSKPTNSKSSHKGSPPIRTVAAPSSKQQQGGAALGSASKAPRSRTCGGFAGGGPFSASPSHSSNSLGQSLPASAGCPAFFSSPKPEAIPMPSLMLTKAAAAAAAAAMPLSVHTGFAIATSAC